ncbi:flagellar basal body rod protein FlgB [candidate division LCP-89 bacterium B3_LCP]|uniref:Flagellar basal body rod protein FlgB n=1 Tax=candidate division LCP-89 bacterium B3_LCP TaxID=2012998 RepID=A0A532V4U5_UNCL8|nr:MAG: flagellar basal body rod protein FlgB [candidate division LCP-89 bacterium B3_LCP]
MLKELLFGRTQIPLLTRGLDALHLRQKAIAKNIANAQSSGYKRSLVEFEGTLQKVIKQDRRDVRRTHRNHILPNRKAANVRPFMRQANNRIDGSGSETVVAEREMADLAQTQIKYEAEVKLTRHHFELIKMAIRGMG